MAAAMPAMAESSPSAGNDAAAEWEAMCRAKSEGAGRPCRRQPLDFGRLAGRRRALFPGDDSDWPSSPRNRCRRTMTSVRLTSRFASGWRRLFRLRHAASHTVHARGRPDHRLRRDGRLVLALMIWRVDIVRLLPQTATFYRMVGLDVNLRGLVFKDVKITPRPWTANRCW